MRINLVKDPEVFGKERPHDRPLVLALDLATLCGYCVAYYDQAKQPSVMIEPRLCGQFDLSAGPYDSGAIRFVRLRQFLHYLSPQLVVYEEVRVTPPEKVTRYNATLILARAATSAELIGAYKTTVCTWCEEHDVPCTGFPIGTIKKRATGRGNANKEDMIRAANETFGLGLEVEGYESTGADNVADSVFVCLLGLEHYGAGLKGEKS